MSFYDEGHSSAKSSSSEDSEVRHLKLNEFRNDAGLSPRLSRRQALRSARAGPFLTSDTMEVLDYGSADESNAKVDLSASDSSEEDEESQHTTVVSAGMKVACAEATFDMNVSTSMEVDLNVEVIPEEVPMIDRSAVYNASANTAGKLDDLLRLATHYARGPRDEAIRERSKNLELKDFIVSKGFNMQDVNDHLGLSEGLRRRQVDDFGFILAPKKNHLNELKRSFTVDNGILTLDKQGPSSCTVGQANQSGNTVKEVPSKRILALPWNEVVKKSNVASKEETSTRVSALDPSRLLIKDSSDKSVSNPLLSFKPTTDISVANGSQCVTIAPPLDFLKNARKMWDSSLVAYFASASLPFDRTRSALFKLWGPMGLQKVFFNSKGFYTLKFKLVSDMEEVLKLGSIIIDKRKLFLRPWMEGTNFQKNQITSVPIWIKFVNVPHSYWTVEGLSYIASAIGVPISLDSPTSNLEPMKYARICVNLKFDSTRPKEILVPVLSDDDGSLIMDRVHVEYPMLPPNCSHCSCFGHSLSKCSVYRIHLDTLQQSTMSLVKKKNMEMPTVSRTGKEVLGGTEMVGAQGEKYPSPSMISFVQPADPIAAKKFDSNIVDESHKMVNEQVNNPIGESSAAQLLISKSLASTYHHWSMGPCSMGNHDKIVSAKTQVQVDKVEVNRGIGPISVEIFGPSVDGQAKAQTSGPKTKRKKRVQKNRDSNMNMETPTDMAKLNPPFQVQQMEVSKAPLAASGSSQHKVSATVMTGASDIANHGFTRVTRRTANKTPALGGNPASRY